LWAFGVRTACLKIVPRVSRTVGGDVGRKALLGLVLFMQAQRVRLHVFLMRPGKTVGMACSAADVSVEERVDIKD